MRTFSNLRSEEEDRSWANHLYLLDEERETSIFIFMIVFLEKCSSLFLSRKKANKPICAEAIIWAGSSADDQRIQISPCRLVILTTDYPQTVAIKTRPKVMPDCDNRWQ